MPQRRLSLLHRVRVVALHLTHQRVCRYVVASCFAGVQTQRAVV